MTAYFISGLGADSRIFRNLRLPSDVAIVHINWLEPLANEPLIDYCRRLATVIDTTEEFVLIGMSFGGMVATEIAQLTNPKQTIVISSAGSRKDLPWYFRIAGTLKLYKLVSPFLLKSPPPFIYWIFDARTKEERRLLKQYLRNTSPTYLKWAIKAILTWKRVTKPENLLHIHGSADKVLPVTYTDADIIIRGGGHLMVHNMADKISRILVDHFKVNL